MKLDDSEALLPTGDQTAVRRLSARVAELEALLESRDQIVARESARRQQALDDLGRSEANFRGLVELSRDAIFVDRDGIIVYVNPALVRLLGYDNEAQLIGNDSLSLFVHPDDHATTLDYRARFMAGPSVPMPIEVRWVRRDGSVVWVRGYRRPVMFDGATADMASAQDITEIRSHEVRSAAMQEELVRSAGRYRLLFEKSPTAKVVFDAETLRFLEVNDAALRMYGYTREEFLGMRLTDLRPPDDASASIEAFRELIGTQHMGVRRHIRKDGRLIDVDVVAHSILFAERKAVLGMQTDVTESRRLEEELRHTQKMEAVGRLAGGIAHDFNNMLAVILSSAAFLEAGLAHDDGKRRDVRAIVEAAERAAAMVRQLLAFSRKQASSPTVLDLNMVVTDLAHLLERLLGEHIEMRLALSPDLDRVRADKGQLDQVIANLAVNARDAMPSGGRLTVSTANVELNAAGASPHPEIPRGRYVCITVSDTGFGMTPEVCARIFEPFFTTKGPGEGTGLGLAIVYGIVKQSEGYVTVRSEPGKGTVFAVYLPRTDTMTDRPPGSEPSAPAVGRETVLVVEDEATVRQVACAVLTRAGYTVIGVGSGDEALAIAAGGTPIDLVLTDVIMPGISGPSLAARLAELYPKLRVLYMSGYAGGAMFAQRGLAGGPTLVEKPFSPARLCAAVRAELDDPSAGGGRATVVTPPASSTSPKA